VNVVEQALEYADVLYALVHFNGELLDLSVIRPAPADALPLYATRAVLLRAETRGHPERPEDELVALTLHPQGALYLGPDTFTRGVLRERRLENVTERELILELGGIIVRLHASAQPSEPRARR
jgi:hypothetical protein